MAYVRTKRVGDYTYHQLVKSVRIDGKPRQKVLVHLGRHTTMDRALKEWPKEVRKLRGAAREDRRILDSWDPAGRNTAAYRNVQSRAEGAEKRANDLEANLKKLRKLKKQGGL